jgi:ADP-heptose:LPS heptosyltransferase
LTCKIPFNVEREGGFFDISMYKNERFSNIINLRSTAKNSLVTHGAIQKVFKTRFDENRSHTKLQDFSNSFVTSPFVTSSRVNYEQILKKNKETFFKINLHKFNFKNLKNVLNTAKDGLNFYFFDFPFLLSLKSDPSRYI